MTDKPKKKDPNRPRQLCKLGLKPGDVVRLVRWEGGESPDIHRTYTVNPSASLIQSDLGDVFAIETTAPKGARWLFTVVSRAQAEETPTAPQCDEWPIAATTSPPLTASGARSAYDWGIWFGAVLWSFDRKRNHLDTHKLALPTKDGDLIPGSYIGPDGATIVIEALK